MPSSLRLPRKQTRKELSYQPCSLILERERITGHWHYLDPCSLRLSLAFIELLTCDLECFGMLQTFALFFGLFFTFLVSGDC